MDVEEIILVVGHPRDSIKCSGNVQWQTMMYLLTILQFFLYLAVFSCLIPYFPYTYKIGL